MKLCDTCIYRNNVEQLKPCIIYRDNCEYYEKERGDMTNEQAKAEIMQIYGVLSPNKQQALDMAIEALKQYGALQEIQKEICDMYPNYTDEKGYRMIRKSDVLNIIDKHIKEIEE